ncbi:MAG: monophosphatase [Halanaerobiales bacterium]|nr:monophosphatase [Halanaerobiales bacterium]
MDLKKVMAELEELIRDIGKYQLTRFNQEIKIETKLNSSDLVTEVDKISEEKITDYIREKYPTHSILAEESGKIDKGADYRWIIDPLDGTNNYAHGFSIFTISIALEYKGQTVLGAVYYPKQDELFTAIRGEGAYLNGNRIRVTDREDLSQALLATGFPYSLIDMDYSLKLFNNIVKKAQGIRRTGSAAFDLCNLARGSFDGFWELGLSLWDIAAGKLIVEEAGGRVIIFSRENGFSLVAGNKIIAGVLLREIKSLG